MRPGIDPPELNVNVSVIAKIIQYLGTRSKTYTFLGTGKTSGSRLPLRSGSYRSEISRPLCFCVCIVLKRLDKLSIELRHQSFAFRFRVTGADLDSQGSL